MNQVLLLSLGLLGCAVARPPPPISAAALDGDLSPPALPGARDPGRIAAAFGRADPKTQALYTSDVLLAADLGDDAAARSLVPRLLDGRVDLRSALGEAAQRARRAGLLGLARLEAQRAAELGGGLGPGEAAVLRHRLSMTDDPAAPAALLLRHASCTSALRDAAQAPYPLRLERAAACLYAVLPGDPGVRVKGPPGRRPPDPSWAALRAQTAPLLGEAARRAPRLGPLAAALRQREEELFQRLEREGLIPPDQAEAFAGLPVVRSAERALPDDGPAGALPPYDREPLVRLRQGRVWIGREGLPAADPALAERLSRLLRGDGRRRLAVAVDPAEAGAALLSLAAQGRRLGLQQLLVLVRPEAGTAAPAALAVPLELANDPPAEAVVPTGGERGPGLGPLAPTLVIGRAAGGGAAAELRDRDGAVVLAVTGAPHGDELAMSALLDALPDLEPMPLSIEGDLSLSEALPVLVKVHGRLPRLRLTAAPPRERRGEASRALLQRLQRRLRVAIEGTLTIRGRAARPLGAGGRLLRGCYLDALDRRPARGGREGLRAVVRLRITPQGAAEIVDRGGLDLHDAALLSCLQLRAPALATGAEAGLTISLADSNHRPL